MIVNWLYFKSFVEIFLYGRMVFGRRDFGCVVCFKRVNYKMILYFVSCVVDYVDVNMIS